MNYMGPKVLAEYFHKHASALGLNKDCRILDVGAGTGLAGVEVSSRTSFSPKTFYEM